MISIVDDDKSFREATKRLMRSMGYHVSMFESAEDFLRSDRVSNSSCLIVDMHMPGLSGAELQQHLISAGNLTPIIFVSAAVHERVREMVIEAGAIGFLSKPFQEQALINCLDLALSGEARPSN